MSHARADLTRVHKRLTRNGEGLFGNDIARWKLPT
jgi:hypothetical protein